MRVALLSYRGNPYCGGQGIYILNLVRELARNNVTVDVIVGPPYPENLDAWAETFTTENLHLWAVKTRDFPVEKLKRILRGINFIDYLLTRFHFFGEIETFSFRAFFTLARLMRTRRYDIIHDVNSLGWGLLPCTLLGVPVISTIHHPLTRDRNADIARNTTFWSKITTLLFYPVPMQKFVINRIHGVITSFKGGVEELHRAFGLDPQKVAVVYNGMDLDSFVSTGKKREPKSLLFVGNSEDEKKGIRYLLEAMTILPEDITLTIVDAITPLKTKARDLIKSLDLEQRVIITGRLSITELAGLYNTMTILVAPSLFEGFGLPAAEAMACGMPVIASRAGALPEVVSDETGILVEPGNSRALAEAVLRLMGNPSLRKKMGSAGIQKVTESFSWKSAGKNTIRVYEDVIGRYGSTA